jgi:hypothetical protein
LDKGKDQGYIKKIGPSAQISIQMELGSTADKEKLSLRPHKKG